MASIYIDSWHEAHCAKNSKSLFSETLTPFGVIKWAKPLKALGIILLCLCDVRGVDGTPKIRHSLGHLFVVIPTWAR